MFIVLLQEIMKQREIIEKQHTEIDERTLEMEGFDTRVVSSHRVYCVPKGPRGPPKAEISLNRRDPRVEMKCCFIKRK